jgi:hypothetical protein
VELTKTNTLLQQLEDETTIDAIIARKKWLNKALTTQKPHRNYVDPIQQPTDEPFLILCST